MVQTILKTKNQRTKHALLYRERNEYREAWKRLQQLSSRLPGLWRTKKTSLQILKEERSS